MIQFERLKQDRATWHTEMTEALELHAAATGAQKTEDNNKKEGHTINSLKTEELKKPVALDGRNCFQGAWRGQASRHGVSAGIIRVWHGSRGDRAW